MNPVVAPTTVGDLAWPVLSAVRVSTAEHPAEFVVLVDCGEPTPRQPYATLRLYVWPDHDLRGFAITEGCSAANSSSGAVSNSLPRLGFRN
jgi:hypothetical protein